MYKYISLEDKLKSMEEKGKLLFIGELPETIVHGISISNRLNINILQRKFHIDIIDESVKIEEHKRVTFNKTKKSFKSILLIIWNSLFGKYDYFYSVLSLSVFGSFRSMLYVLIFSLLNRGKIVLHIHRGDFFSRYYNSAINRMFSGIIIRFSDIIIVLSESQKNEFEKVFKREFSVLRNTVEFENISSAYNSLNNNLLFISNYIRDKGIIDLLEAFKGAANKNSTITLSTYGEFTDSKLREVITGYESERIIINGPLNTSLKYDILSNCACLVLPSWNEGQPLVILEAMFLGVPVIASRVGLIPEMVGKDYKYLFDPGNVDQLEKKILSFAEEKDREQLSSYLREKYNEEYSFRKHSDSLLNIFSL